MRMSPILPRCTRRFATNALLFATSTVACFSQTSARTESLGNTPPVYPLESLSKKEILETVEVLRVRRQSFSDTSRYSLITLHEPPKQEVLRFQPGTPFARESFAVVYERATNQTSEAIVDLQKRSLAFLEDNSRRAAFVSARRCRHLAGMRCE